MPLRIESMVQSTALKERYIFLSSSIPDPERWVGKYQPYEITDAVVAAVRAILTSTGRIVCAAHPTVAPLLLSVASTFPLEERKTPLVLIYQSELFSEVVVEETRQMEERPGLGEIRWTKAGPGDHVEGDRSRSLAIMRRAMLQESDPAAAVFIGGMEGIPEEFEMFGELYPSRPVYPLARPGGAAAQLVERVESQLKHQLATSDVYPALMQQIVADLAAHLD